MSPKPDLNRAAIEPLFISIADAATALAVVPWTVRQLVARRKLKACKLGRRTLIEAKSLHAYAAGLPKARLAPVRRAG